MFIVDGEALGSILHSALTKTGKPRKDAPAMTPDTLSQPQTEEGADPTSAPTKESSDSAPPPAKAPARSGASTQHKEGHK